MESNRESISFAQTFNQTPSQSIDLQVVALGNNDSDGMRNDINVGCTCLEREREEFESHMKAQRQILQCCGSTKKGQKTKMALPLRTAYECSFKRSDSIHSNE